MAYPALKTPPELPRERSGKVLPLSRIPQISIQAFCETPETTAALSTAFADRRMTRANCAVQAGGAAAAIEAYRQAASPHLLIVESHADSAALLAQLDALADVCDVNTKVIVVGGVNDVALYRDLLASGVSEYLVSPVDPVALIGVVARLYDEPGARKLGRTLAFVGAKGGAGSSSICHNVAFTLGRRHASPVALMDLDLPFGSMGLSFNLETAQGIEQVIGNEAGIDDVLLERLLVKHGDHLRILTAPGLLEHGHDANEGVFERALDVAQSSFPFVVLDVPHVWTSWTRKTLLRADDVVIVATPDLASLRNARSLVDLLREERPNDGAPKLVLNQVGMPKRTEISPEKFADVLQVKPTACIPFEPAPFSAAANEGKMLAEVAAKATACPAFDQIAEILSGKPRPTEKATGLFSLSRLWRK